MNIQDPHDLLCGTANVPEGGGGAGDPTTPSRSCSVV